MKTLKNLGILFLAVFITTVAVLGTIQEAKQNNESPEVIYSTEVRVSEEAGTYVFRFAEVLGSHDTVLQVLFVLKHAQAGDVCVFRLAGLGGNADTLLELDAAIHESRCKSVMNVEGDVYSAFAYLAVDGEELHVASGKFLMFHTVQIGGDDDDSYRNSKIGQEVVRMFDAALSTIARPYLTQSELSHILANHNNEVYVMGPTMECRFKAVKAGVDIGRCSDLASSILTDTKTRLEEQRKEFMDALLKALEGQQRAKSDEQCNFN